MINWLKSMDVMKAFTRFPMAVILAIITSLIAVYAIDNEGGRWMRYIIAGYMATMTAINLHLLSDLFNNNRFIKIISLLGPIATAVAWIWYMPLNIDEMPLLQGFRAPYVIAAWIFILHLCVAFIPFITRAQNEDFWEYNRELFLRFIESAIFSAVIFAGLSIALLALDQLFGIDIKGQTYGRLFVLLAGVFNTVYFLSNFPKPDADGQVSTPLPAFLILVQYILLPISCLYLIILFAYGLKIGIEGELPRGWVTQLSMWFSIVAIISWLLNYYVYLFSKNRLSLIYKKYIFIALIIPIILLIIAISVRIGEYGLTENRYIIALIAGWLIFISSYLGFNKKGMLKVIPISLSIITLLAIVPSPISMFNRSIASQANRLKSSMTELGILENRKIVKPIAVENKRLEAQVNEGISALRNRGAVQIIDEWLDEPLITSIEKLSPSEEAPTDFDISRALGLDPNELATETGSIHYFNFNADNSMTKSIAGFDSIRVIEFMNTSQATKYSVSWQGALDGTVLTVNIHEQTWTVNLDPFIRSQLARDQENAIPIDLMSFDLYSEDSSRMARLFIEYLSGNLEDNLITIESGQGSVAWR